MQAREKLAAHHEHKLSAETLRAYLAQHGRSIALYSNKHRIFWVNHPDHEGVLTQFTRAFRTLDIEPIHANTPQAKERVERANQILQDRLVKELRLAGISDIDAANAFLPGFLSDYNLRFAVPPQNPSDAHRPVLHDPQELDWIFSLHAQRKLSKNLTFQYKKTGSVSSRDRARVIASEVPRSPSARPSTTL